MRRPQLNRIARSRRRLFGAATVLAMTTLAACSGSTSAPRGPSAPLRITSVHSAYPIGLVWVGERPWVVDADQGTVASVGTRTADAVHVGTTPLRAAYDGRLIWVTDFGSGQVVAVDPGIRRVVRSVPLDGQPEGIVSAFGHVWVVQQQARRLVELSDSGRVVRRIQLGGEPRQVIAGGRSLFVSDYAGGRAWRVDPASGETTASARLCAGAQGMALLSGHLWVTCTSADAVVTVDARTLRPVGRATVSGEPDAIAAVAGRVWVAATAGPRLDELSPDPRHPEVRAAHVLGKDQPLRDSANVDLLLHGRRFWITSPNGARVISGEVPG